MKGAASGAAAIASGAVDSGMLTYDQVVETGTPQQFFSAPGTERGKQFLQRFSEDHAAV